jgi:hypothetical protein
LYIPEDKVFIVNNVRTSDLAYRATAGACGQPGKSGPNFEGVAQAADSFRRNSSMCGKLTLLAPYF